MFPYHTPYDGPLGTLIMGQPYDFFPNPTLWFPKIRGTPSHHPFIDGIFRYKQSIWLLGYPIYGNPHIWINPKSIVSDASTQRFWWQAATKSSGKRWASLDTENPHRPTSLWVLAPATADDPFRATSKNKKIELLMNPNIEMMMIFQTLTGFTIILDLGHQFVHRSNTINQGSKANV